MQSFALRGNILFTPAPDRLELQPRGYLVCREGSCEGVFPALPEGYSGLPVQDFGDALIVPGYTDLHLHAPQYGNMGLGMDEELLDWWRIIPIREAAFSDIRYAEEEYGRFTEELRNSFTVRALIFATNHTPATLLLMEKLERSGLRAMVGKVSMDRNCPDGLREGSARAALEAAREWLGAEAERFENVSPILTPALCRPAAWSSWRAWGNSRSGWVCRCRAIFRRRRTRSRGCAPSTRMMPVTRIYTGAAGCWGRIPSWRIACTWRIKRLT